MREELRTLKRLAPEVERELGGDGVVADLEPDDVEGAAREAGQAGLADFGVVQQALSVRIADAGARVVVTADGCVCLTSAMMVRQKLSKSW